MTKSGLKMKFALLWAIWQDTWNVSLDHFIKKERMAIYPTSLVWESSEKITVEVFVGYLTVFSYEKYYHFCYKYC